MRNAFGSIRLISGVEFTWNAPWQSSVYQRLFQQQFDAHDALEDVLALKKILLSSALAIDTKTIVNTVEALVSDHPRELKKVVATRTGRLREFDREIAQCRKNYLYVYTVFKLIFF